MNICLYGASSNKIDSKYISEVEQLGRMMGRRGHGLVFGGGADGLMGAAARGVFTEKGYIKGIAPSFFDVDGRLFSKCTEFVYTETMRERKQLMENSADAFVVVPGGIGTFEEYFEILTLKQLGCHNKPIAIFNICGYFDKIEEMLQYATECDFMNEQSLELYKVFEDPEELLDYFENYNEPVLNIFNLKHI